MSGMNGLSQDPVRAIQGNLKQYNYRDGFPLLKELIQNACDAGASTLQLYYYKGIKNAVNPLFAKEGVLIYNDGAFSDADAQKISELGGDRKWQDAETIGKYGLGLKSVFHLCDAFIYYNHANQKKELDALCPFFGGSKYEKEYKSKKWDDLESDRLAFIEFVESTVGKRECGLTILVPFEVESFSPIVEKTRDIRTKHPFNKNDPNDKHLIQNLITTFAILSQTAKKKSLREFVYRMEEKSIKLFVHDDRIEIKEEKNGQNPNNYKSDYTVLCVDNWADAEANKSFIDKIREVIPEESRDKIFDEQKMVFELVKTPKSTERAKLRLTFASYLPLPAQDGVDDRNLNGDYDYNIIIHAPFAIDSGRCGIEGFADLCEPYDVANISRNVYDYWNRFLFQNFIAPNIVRLLNQGIKNIIEKKDCPDVVCELRNILEKSQKKCADFLFRDYGLVYEYIDKGYQWNLIIPKDQRKVFIPQENAPLFNSVFNGFDVLEDTHLLQYSEVLGDRMHFFPSDAAINTSFASALVLQIVQKACNRDGLAFLDKFLQYNKPELASVGENAEALQKNFRILLRKLKYSLIQSNLELIHSITENLHFEYYELNSSSLSWSQEKIWDKLWADNCPYVVIPTLAKDTRKIEIFKADSWIGFISQQKFPDSLNRPLIEQLVGSLNSVLDLIKNKYSDLPLFEVIKIGSKDPVQFLSLNALSKNAVFKRLEEKDKDNIVFQLAKTLKCGIYKAVGSFDRRAFDCNKEGVIECLSCYCDTWCRKNAFVESEKENLLNKIFDFSYKEHRITREEVPLYLTLLSGLKFVENCSKVIVFDKGCSEVLKDVYKAYIGGTENKTILKLDNYRYDFFEHNRDFFGDNIITERSCIDLLKNANDMSFLKEPHILEKRVDILKKIWNYEQDCISDDSLYLRVPLHKMSSGDCKSFRKGILFNKHGYKIPIDNPPDFIVCETDSDLALYQEKIFTTDRERVLTASKALKILFERESNLAKHKPWIIARIKENQKVPESDKSIIFSKEWIPVRSGKYCALKDVILPSYCSAQCAEMLKANLSMSLLEDVQASDEERDAIKKYIANNYEDADSFVNAVIKKIEQRNFDYIRFSDDQKDVWRYALESGDIPVFNIFYALLQSGKMAEDVLWNRYRNIALTSQLVQDTGLRMLNSIVNTPYTSIKQILFCEIFKLIYKSCDIAMITRFPTRKGSWEAADKLSIEFDRNDVDDCYKPCQELESFLRQSDHGSKINIIENEGNLEDVFSTINSNWRNACKSKGYVDVILYLLNGNYRERASCQQTVKNALKNLFDNTHALDPGQTNQKYIIDSYKVKERFDLKSPFPKICLDVNATDSVITESLLGQKISLPKSNSSVYNNSKRDYPTVKDAFFCEIYNLSENSGCNEDGIDSSLRQFMIRLLSDVYRIKTDNVFYEYLNPLVAQITKVNQVAIGAAENRIFSGLFDSLVGLKHEKIRQLDNAYNELFEKTEGLRPADPKSQNELLDKLLNLVKSDEDVQNKIFNRVKKTVQQNQYSVSSIIFELFQNADDCVNDFQLNNREIKDSQRRFVVQDDGQRIRVMHFGRKINEIFFNENDNKFKWDLLNMLKLSHSEKTFGDSGKFGLGFKSIYTLCRKPIVRSGDLQFEIIAGLYPKKIDFDKDFQECTCIDLPYENAADAYQCVSQFREKCSLLTLFSKQINRIEIGDAVITCKKEPLLALDNVKVEKVILSDLTLLMIESEDDGYKILFKYDDVNDSIEPLYRSIPKVWNLAPLEDAKSLPFIINACFEVDTGRLNLAGNNVNEAPLRKIAESLVLILTKLNDYKPGYVDNIISIMLSACSAQDELFIKFARIVVEGIYNNLDKISTGYTKCIESSSNNSLYILDLSNLSEQPNELAEKISEFMGENVIASNANNVYEELLAKKEVDVKRITFYDVFRMTLQDCEIDYDNMNGMFDIYQLLNSDSQLLFWKKFEGIDSFKLKNKLDEFKPISDLELQSSDQEKTINREYYANHMEILTFLGGIETLERNAYISMIRRDLEPVSMPIEIDFPRKSVSDWEKLLSHVQVEIEGAPSVKYEKKMLSTRISIEGEKNKSYLRSMYLSDCGQDKQLSACQLCHRPSFYFECVGLKKMPRKELSPLFLCLCPSCATIYRQFRGNTNTCISILKSIRDLSREEIDASSDHVDIHLDDAHTLWFTQTHIAEIQEILKTIEEDDSTESESVELMNENDV